MNIQFHPSAANNFNNKAVELLQLVQPAPHMQSRTSKVFSERYVSASFDESNIIGDIEPSKCDHKGNIVERLFNFNGEKFTINNYREVNKLAEAIQSTSLCRDKLSFSFIEQNLFAWIKDTFKKNHDLNFTTFFIDKALLNIKKLTFFTPISNLHVEEPFKICSSEIRIIKKEHFDEMQSTSALPKEIITQFRKEYQGLACVVTDVEAEPDYASDVALEEAKKVVSVLAIFSRATLIPDIMCMSQIKGLENIKTVTSFIGLGGETPAFSSQMLDTASMEPWFLSKIEVEELKKLGIEKISKLITTNQLNNFKESVLNSLMLYSKSAFTADPLDKLVFMLSSLESLLLKSANEPIQQNLAERMAIFSQGNLTDRKNLIKTTRSVYALRSNYLHHGKNSENTEIIEEFMKFVCFFYMTLLQNIDRYDTKEEFLNAIDDHKMS
jgi:hypothetical protein